MPRINKYKSRSGKRWKDKFKIRKGENKLYNKKSSY